MRRRLTEQQTRFLSESPVQYGDALLKYAVRFLGYQPHLLPLAEDAVQETYIKAIENVDDLMQHANPAAWLKLCLKRILLNHLRSASHQREELTENLAQLPAVTADAIQTALDRWSDRVSLQDVREMAALLLTPDEQQTFDDHFLYGFTTDETALLEGISSATVRGRISRIRKKMKKYFAHMCVFLFVMCYFKWR